VGLPTKKLPFFSGEIINWYLGNRMYKKFPVFAARSTFLQTDCSVEARLKEHQWHIRLEQPGKSTVAEHSVDLGYLIQFHNTSAHS
jgi:hypothetical protein